MDPHKNDLKADFPFVMQEFDDAIKDDQSCTRLKDNRDEERLPVKKVNSGGSDANYVCEFSWTVQELFLSALKLLVSLPLNIDFLCGSTD